MKAGMIDQIKYWTSDEEFQKLYNKILPEAGSKALQAAIKKALNKIAYDTATYIGSGGKGQKPMFITEGWGKYMSNIADEAAGDFIESLGKQWNMNFCSAGGVKIKIMLGLQAQQRPSKPACTFTKMLSNWDSAIKDKNFLTNFQDMFEPTSNDLGAALTSQSSLLQNATDKTQAAINERLTNKGWLDIKQLLGDKYVSAPGDAEKKVKTANDLLVADFGKYTGAPLVDAVNVFLNQLAITAFQNLMSHIGAGAKDYTSPYSGDYGLGNLGNANSAADNGGANAAADNAKKILQPSFAVRGDYDILGELSACPNADKAGPTNCVLTEKFRQAIIEKKTVGEAISEGTFNANGIFGFIAGGNLEPRYKDENYPYRSMIILRKFRIIPVGWEAAAEYIKDHPEVGTRNLGDMVACFDPSDDYKGYNQPWCHGLVDPSWVLKAPLNYCKKEGPGPEIISEQVSGEGLASSYNIGRNDNYCADEQSCIKENADGSCVTYGYCTEERRTWNFGKDACEPRDNTCETFTAAGQSVSYLTNTLDYGICNVGNAGCKAYAQSFDAYSSSTDQVAWNNKNNIYLDRNVATCDPKNEGCHALIRTKAGLGTNLLINSGFEDVLNIGGWDGQAAQRSSNDVYEGSYSLNITGNLRMSIIISTSTNPLAGEAFNLSFYAKNCSASDTYSLGGGGNHNFYSGSDWTRYSLFYMYPADDTSNAVQFIFNAGNCLIDAVKLERGSVATAYSAYGSVADITYEKLLPNYLQNVCYQDNGDSYFKKVGAPAKCDNFARQCKREESGCALYTRASDNLTLSAKVTDNDYCPAECLGYDGYTQTQTRFDPATAINFIPSTAKTCGAESAGCEEFTNLDKLNSGAEGIEYFSYLRECVKPDPQICGDFYTWEGSDESGYQLKNFSLKKNGNEPALTGNDSNCNEQIYKLPPSDPNYNPDCRQFYAADGHVSYHAYTLTISCADDCHPYRRTNDQIIYNMIPAESIACSATAKDCREYTGPKGANTKIVLNNNFESGTSAGWIGVNSIVTVSNNSLIAGGHSLWVQNGSRTISANVAGLVEKNKSYVLSFAMKPGAPSGFNKITGIYFTNGVNNAFFTSGLDKKTNGWWLYRVSLSNLDHLTSADEKLFIQADGDYYIDDIKLTEVTDRFYFIKNTWTTPESCDNVINDPAGNVCGGDYGSPKRCAPQEMLGCDLYNDQDRQDYYLHNFTSLCQQDSAGCELMIDTKNSLATTSDDVFTYAVYDKNKLCAAADKSCQRLGLSNQYSTASKQETFYQDAYLKNDPDKAATIQCPAAAVSCQEWSTGAGLSYFKDPGNQACEYRQQYGTNSLGWGWYQKKVNRCGGNNGNICSTDKDCVANQKCAPETVDIPCASSELKTFGTGGVAVDQPSKWAGVCDTAAAGCTEIIDPLSKPAVNLLFNSDFTQDVDGNGADGWEDGARQTVTFNQNTLYVFAIEGSNSASLSVPGQYLYELQGDNTVASSPVSSLSISSGGGRTSKRFYTTSDLPVLTNGTINVGNIGKNNGSKVEIKKAIVDYHLASDIDLASCNGVVDYSKGCLLFNQRDIAGASGLTTFAYDADKTINNSGATPQSGNNNANVLIKVTPDRVCDKWLSCKSMVSIKNSKGQKENTCFDVGLCDNLDANGNCSNFVISPKTNQNFQNRISASQFSNFSGYSKVGEGMSLITDYYPLGAMEQAGETAKISNSNFESYGANGYPIGWSIFNNVSTWDWNLMGVVNNPIAAQTEGVTYPLEGRGFLKLGASVPAVSDLVDVSPNTDYIISGYINTINLHGGDGHKTHASIEVLDGYSDNIIFSSGGLSLDMGSDWTFRMSKFNTGGVRVIKIKLTAYDDTNGGGNCEPANSDYNKCVGNSYFDDVEVMPALNSKDNWYTAQSCRLYPKDDALTCEYNDSSGNKENGMWGYCLEQDRYPGSTNACVLWWPVDEVKGHGVEEGSGYLDKAPLYYCLMAQGYCGGQYKLNPMYYCADLVQVVTETGKAKPWMSRVKSGSTYQMHLDIGHGAFGFIDWGNYSGGGIEKVTLNYSRDNAPFGSIAPPAPINNPYEWDSVANTKSNVSVEPLPILNPNDNNSGGANAGTAFHGVFTAAGGVNCQQNDNTMTSKNHILPYTNNGGDTGGTKTISCPDGYPASGYGGQATAKKSSSGYYRGICVDNTGNKIYTNKHFGPAGNINDCPPGTNLTGCEASGNTSSGTTGECSINCQVKGGYNVTGQLDPLGQGSYDRALLSREVKRIFAQSYGAWEWMGDANNGRYMKINTGWGQWGPPTDVCPGTARPAYPGDYCAIPPRVANVLVNGSGSDITFVKSAFANLTFNSVLDAEQLPLMMYEVDWGDGTKTRVSGIEMRDQPNPKEAHSLYHLYDYWFLKQKVAEGVGGISCDSNQCVVRPKIKIKDNWGWCNDGGQSCNGYTEFTGNVIMKKK
jgi:hypothetical protein